MAPIKFEEHIKERLEQRTIEPTAAAWDRISSKLDAEEGKSSSKKFIWLGIAASFLGGILIATLFFKSETVLQETNTLVQVPETVIPESKSSEVPLENKILKDPEIALQKQETPKQSIVKTNSTPKLKTVPTTKTAVASRDKYNKPPVQTTELKSEKPTINENKESISVAQVEPNIQPTTVTDQDIELLLENAHRELMSERVENQDSPAVVDANALLLDVEAVVDPETFKDKIFKTVKSSLNKAVEAVANKDN